MSKPVSSARSVPTCFTQLGWALPGIGRVSSETLPSGVTCVSIEWKMSRRRARRLGGFTTHMSSAALEATMSALLAACPSLESLEIKHGALLVSGGKVIGRGCNSDRSRMASRPGDANTVALHSEVAALHDAQAWVL